MEYNPESYEHRCELARVLVSTLDESGFVHENQGKRGEAIYSREIPGKRIRVLVYSTIEGNAVRAVGKDAIRVTAVYTCNDGTERSVGKAEGRVYRTGQISDIPERMLGRMREVWAKANTGERCNKCGAPKAESKKGNLYCAEVCWK